MGRDGSAPVVTVAGRSRSSEAEVMGVRGVVVVGCAPCCPAELSRCAAGADQSVETPAVGGLELAHGVERRHASSLIVDRCATSGSAAVKGGACAGLH